MAGMIVACGSSMRQSIDPSADFTEYRTWGWLLPATTDGADRSYQLVVGKEVAAQVVRAMSARGFEYSSESPDLFVRPHVRIQRIQTVVYISTPDEFLPSLHSTPSYLIEGVSVPENRVIESVRLRIAVLERTTGRIVWSGEMHGDFEGSFASSIPESVDLLMAGLPAGGSPSGDDAPVGAVVQVDASASEDLQ